MIATRPALVVFAGLVASCHAQKGCYIHPGGCDCTLREGACTGSSSYMWTDSCSVCGQVDDAEMGTQGCYTGGGCNCDWTQSWCTNTTHNVDSSGTYQAVQWLASGCSTCFVEADNAPQFPDPPPSPPVPPSSPPAPPKPPPAPPQPCIVQNGAGCSRDADCGSVWTPKTTAVTPDPVNEPCYSHSSCAGYSVCCVAIGTCDTTYISSYRKYYLGGCRGYNYKYSTPSSTSSASETYPSTVDGCVKQGECNQAFLELVYGGTIASTSSLQLAPISTPQKKAMLVNLTETYPGACNDVFNVPREAVTSPSHFVTLAITASGDVADYTDSVKADMKANVAQEMSVHPSNVEITVSSGSVNIDISVGLASETAATALRNEMATASASTIGSMLSTSGNTVAVTGVAVGVAGAPDEGGLGVAVIAIIAAVSTLVVLAGLYGVYKKKCAPKSTVDVVPKGAV